jgi:hypothetical protein
VNILANEKATVERLYRLSQLQAQTKRETGDYLTAREIFHRRRATAGNPLRGNQWVVQGYRFALEVPKPDFYYAVAVPVAYGKSGIHSFYIDARGVLRGGDKKGAPASPTDPVFRKQPR